MATTAIWDVRDRLDRVIDYITNPEKTENFDFINTVFQGMHNVLAYTVQDKKTEQQFYVTGINCDPTTACAQMSQTKLRFQKKDGILAYHGYQAFSPGEANAETAHAIGIKLAQELWGERFEVVVSTHLDKQHLHNHFVVNSVSFMDGKRYYDNNTTYAQMRKESDRLCVEYSLSVIENPQRGKSRHYAEWKAEKDGRPTWRGLIQADIDKTIAESMTFTQFIFDLERKGYEVKTGVKYLAVRPPGKERFMRLKTIGDAYYEDAIKQRILKNSVPIRAQIIEETKEKRHNFKGLFSQSKRKKLKGLQALYFHYLYKMGILPRNRAPAEKAHLLLRVDIRYMDILSAQTRLLRKQHIENYEQLSTYYSNLEQKMTHLYDQRKSIYNLIRRCRDDIKISEYKQQIARLTKQIDLLREEVKLCLGIETRSKEMISKLELVRQLEKEKRREEITNEQRSRRRGSDHQYEFKRD